MSSNIIGPKSEFQKNYLESDARILVVGGAAGSSKSYIGLMRHLRWTEDPLYRGFSVRKNSTAIMKEGGLFDQAVQLYSDAYGSKSIQIKLKDQKIVFPSRASVSFTHYENDKAAQAWQGIQSSNTFYDEGTHAEESHIWWLISRLRTNAKLNPSIWISCNPDPDSYLRRWVDWWLYPEGHEKAGLPDPDRNGVTRYILRIGGEIYWSDDPEELYQTWKKPGLSRDDPRQVRPLTFQCLFGTIFDNPTLMENQPEYLASLEAQPEVDRQRLLLGNWDAREQSSTYFNRNWVEEITHIDPTEVVATARSFDFAVTLKSDSNPSPDYTTSVRMRKLKDGRYLIDDVQRTRIRAGDWLNFVIQCTADDPSNTDYYIPLDPGAASKRATELFIRELAESGLYAKKLTTNKSKLERFRPFSAVAQNNGVIVLKGCSTDWENKVFNDNSFFYKEMEAFTGERRRGENGHDDLVDSVSDAFYALASKKQLGNFLGSLKSGMESMKIKPLSLH